MECACKNEGDTITELCAAHRRLIRYASSDELNEAHTAGWNSALIKAKAVLIATRETHLSVEAATKLIDAIRKP